MIHNAVLIAFFAPRSLWFNARAAGGGSILLQCFVAFTKQTQSKASGDLKPTKTTE
jgi:hypothetical protein